MVRLIATLKGSPKDHMKASPPLERDEAEKQLREVRVGMERLGQAAVTLPWAVLRTADIKAVEIKPVSGGATRLV